MSDHFVAEIRLFGFAFAPSGWALCNGQLLPISQNTALFSLLGTVYGGDGRSTFGLPDLRGCVPLHVGASQPGPGLGTYLLGERGGSEVVALLESEMPAHSHLLRAATLDPADANIPSASASLAPSTGGTLYQSTADVHLAPQALAPAGGSTPHNNMQPYLTVNFCIALQGTYPPRT